MIQLLKLNTMGKLAMSSKNNYIVGTSHVPLISFQVPDNYYHDLYKKISQNGELYVIIFKKDRKDRLFFYPGSDKKHIYTAYVFFRRSDADKYVEQVRDTYPEARGSLSVLGTASLDLALSFNRAINLERSLNTDKEYSVMSAIYLHGAFREMEYFWTDDVSKLT